LFSRAQYFGASSGLGKESEYARTAEEATEGRREMLSERIEKETDGEKGTREALAAKQEVKR